MLMAGCLKCPSAWGGPGDQVWRDSEGVKACWLPSHLYFPSASLPIYLPCFAAASTTLLKIALPCLGAKLLAMVSENVMLDNSSGERPQGLPTFCPPPACLGYGQFEQCESPLLIYLPISQGVLSLSAHSIPHTGSYCSPSSAQCSSPPWNCPRNHPMWIRLQTQDKRQQPSRWMVLSVFSHVHWAEWLSWTPASPLKVA